MHTGIRIFSFFLACLMIFTSAPQVFADIFTVGTDDQLASSWEAASNNSDSENTFNMTDNINMEGHTLHAESGKTYVINGNDNYIQNVEIRGESNSDVVINANVNSTTDTALSVTGTSTTDVLVNGNVTTVTDRGANDGKTALQVSNANVTVVGDVGLAVAGGSTNMNAYAVNADTGANITISGDVYSAENGVHENLGADVTINQDLDVRGIGMLVTEGCTLTVEGDVDAGSGHIYGGDVAVDGDMTLVGNLYVSNGSLTMEEGTMLEANQIHIYSGSEVEAGFIDANRVTVGKTGGDKNDPSSLESNTITNDASNSRLETAGDATVEIIGDVDKVIASDDSVVTIYGSADSVTENNNAKVRVEQSEKHPEVEIPDHPNALPKNPANKNDPVVQLCKDYDNIQGSLHEQTEVLFDLMLMVERDLSAEMNVGSALWASLFSYSDIIIDVIIRDIPEEAAIYNKDMYNADSVESLKDAKWVNPYYVATYKDTLAKAIEDLTPVKLEVSETEKNLITAVYGLAGNVKDAGPTVLSKDELKYLETLMNEGGAFTPEDAQMYILMTEDAVINGTEARKLSDLVTISSTIAKNAEFLSFIAQAGITVTDFIAHIFGEYESQISYLDNLLTDHKLSPALFIAAVELRLSYSYKLAGALEGAMESMMKYGLEWAMDECVGLITNGGLWGIVNLGVNIFGFVSGGNKDSKDLQAASAMPTIANVAMNNYTEAIRRVQNGDTSDEAIQQVKSSFVVLRTTLSEMCKIMTNIGDKDQEETYQKFIDALDNIKLGYTVEID